MTSILAIVPAAGRGARFARATGRGEAYPKFLEPVAGEPMLARTLRSLLTGGVDRAIVVVAPETDPTGLPMAADPRVLIVTNPDPGQGMFSSIRTGLNRAAGGDPILVLPADMPYVQPATVASLIQACRQAGTVVVPRHGGKRGHPLAVPGWLLPRLLAAAAETTLSDVLKALPVAALEVEVADPGILRDVDLPADLG
jgi:molybdenum cofactor cytidylyltransferase